VRVGVDASFHHVEIRWRGEDVELTRGRDFVAAVRGVVAIDEERRYAEETRQHLLLLRMTLRAGGARLFFLDGDPVQTNVREVAPELDGLDAVLAWLLPPGYAHRQGDVGLYRGRDLPPAARPVAPAEYPQAFVSVLSERHHLEPAAACEFFAGGDRFFVRVARAARLVHPEHPALALGPGLYELVGARGTPLPHFVGLRDGETAALEE
jgi:hypothetical protein